MLHQEEIRSTVVYQHTVTTSSPLRLISREYRFRPGLGSRFPSRPGLRLEFGSNTPHPQEEVNIDSERMETSMSAGEGQEDAPGDIDQSQAERDIKRKSLLRIPSLKIGTLGYFVEEDFGHYRRNHTCESAQGQNRPRKAWARRRCPVICDGIHCHSISNDHTNT